MWRASVLVVLSARLVSAAPANHTPKREWMTVLPPNITFSCEGRTSGYYADMESGCQMYHMCDPQSHRYSYLCPSLTEFSQFYMTCVQHQRVNCSTSKQYFHMNEMIGKPRMKLHHHYKEGAIANKKKDTEGSKPSSHLKEPTGQLLFEFEAKLDMPVKRSQPHSRPQRPSSGSHPPGSSTRNKQRTRTSSHRRRPTAASSQSRNPRPGSTVKPKARNVPSMLRSAGATRRPPIRLPLKQHQPKLNKTTVHPNSRPQRPSLPKTLTGPAAIRANPAPAPVPPRPGASVRSTTSRPSTRGKPGVRPPGSKSPSTVQPTQRAIYAPKNTRETTARPSPIGRKRVETLKSSQTTASSRATTQRPELPRRTVPRTTTTPNSKPPHIRASRPPSVRTSSSSAARINQALPRNTYRTFGPGSFQFGTGTTSNRSTTGKSSVVSSSHRSTTHLPNVTTRRPTSATKRTSSSPTTSRSSRTTSSLRPSTSRATSRPTSSSRKTPHTRRTTSPRTTPRPSSPALPARRTTSRTTNRSTTPAAPKRASGRVISKSSHAITRSTTKRTTAKPSTEPAIQTPSAATTPLAEQRTTTERAITTTTAAKPRTTTKRTTPPTEQPAATKRPTTTTKQRTTTKRTTLTTKQRTTTQRPTTTTTKQRTTTQRPTTTTKQRTTTQRPTTTPKQRTTTQRPTTTTTKQRTTTQKPTSKQPIRTNVDTTSRSRVVRPSRISAPRARPRSSAKSPGIPVKRPPPAVDLEALKLSFTIEPPTREDDENESREHTNMKVRGEIITGEMALRKMVVDQLNPTYFPFSSVPLNLLPPLISQESLDGGGSTTTIALPLRGARPSAIQISARSPEDGTLQTLEWLMPPTGAEFKLPEGRRATSSTTATIKPPAQVTESAAGVPKPTRRPPPPKPKKDPEGLTMKFGKTKKFHAATSHGSPDDACYPCMKSFMTDVANCHPCVVIR